MIENRQSVNTNDTPKQITTSMIDADLKGGLNKSDMMEKYNIRKWEIDRIFKNPKLAGRRPSPKLSFTFIDDMDDSGHQVDNIDEVLEEVDPNQVTLEEGIADAIEEVSFANESMQKTQEAIIDMLSPTEYEDDLGTPPTIEETLEVVKEQEMEVEETVEDDFDTFEL